MCICEYSSREMKKNLLKEKGNGTNANSSCKKGKIKC